MFICLPACLPGWLVVCLVAWLADWLPASQPACLAGWQNCGPRGAKFIECCDMRMLTPWVIEARSKRPSDDWGTGQKAGKPWVYTPSGCHGLSMDFLDEVLDFGQYYLGLDSDFIIKLVFLSDLGKQVWGYCNGLEDEDYVIEISSNINTSDMVETIFHELVHVKQIIDGRLDEDGRTWKGKTYDTTKTPYKELPWEIEAFRLQRLMTKEFFSA